MKRRTAVFAAAALLARFQAPCYAVEPAARVTSRVSFTIKIGTDEPRTMEVGLFGDAAPSSTTLFRELCEGSVPDEPSLTYRYALVTRIVKDKEIVIPPEGEAVDQDVSIDWSGRVRTKDINKAERFTNSDSNALSHDRPGLVSMRRGGGAFEFRLLPAANPELDTESIVIGQVIEGLDLLQALNEVPVRQPKVETTVFRALGTVARDPRANEDTVYKPLRKVRILSSTVL